jgi:hypothetical protein
MRRSLALFPGLLLTLASCGSSAGPTYAPPLLSIDGTITASTIPTASTVHVALVWQLLDASGFRAAQELAIRAEFPATFHLDVRQLPPPEVITPVDPALVKPGFATGAALGTLIVYEDTNDNGELDLLPIDATQSVDRVLGIPERLEIIYLEGGGIPKKPDSLPTDLEEAVELSAGFNLILEPKLEDPEPGCSSCGTNLASNWTRLEPSERLTIALTADPRLSRALCQTVAAESVTSSGSCEPCIGDGCAQCPIDANAEVKCSADQTAFVAESCDAASLCAVRDCHYVSGRLDETGHVPSAGPADSTSRGPLVSNARSVFGIGAAPPSH